jgi:16S rRNA (adenine1518-N6/adenine1519-N6)-dimethyltransferase
MSERFKTKKSLGQHFLRDDSVIHQIISAIQPKKTDHIIEIGPGQGALTQYLLPTVNQLDVIEYDKEVIPILERRCAGLGNLLIHQGDVLQFDFKTCFMPNKRYRIVGNLPYNISTPLFFYLLQYADHIDDMVFMIQKEVAERITAAPNTKSYGRLSVMLQYYCETTYLFSVPPSAFSPPPKVVSGVIGLKPYREKKHFAENETLFATLVRDCFNLRRKTLRNTLKNYINSAISSELAFDLSLRPENLSVADFVHLSNVIHQRSI